MSFLTEIPDSVWGAFIGVASTLSATLLANVYSSIRQKRELEHQASQKQMERMHTLRKEVYLPLIEAANGAMVFLSQLATAPMREIANSENALQKLAAHYSRMLSIAPRAVFEGLHSVFTQLTKAFLILSVKRVSITAVGARLSILEKNINESVPKQRLMYEQYLTKGEADPKLIAWINNEGENISKMLNEQRELMSKKTKMEMELSYQAMEEIKVIREKMLQSLIEIRGEFGTSTESWFKEAFERSQQEIETAFKEFQSNIDAELKRHYNESPTS